MSDVKNVEAVAPAKPETARLNGLVPLELFDKLMNDDRYEKRMEKGEYIVHMLEVYASTLSPKV